MRKRRVIGAVAAAALGAGFAIALAGPASAQGWVPSPHQPWSVSRLMGTAPSPTN